jgi:hypothetical protein
MGFDLNRTWHQISRWAHPTLHAVHTMLTELDQNKVSVIERTIYQVINHTVISTFRSVEDFEQNILHAGSFSPYAVSQKVGTACCLCFHCDVLEFKLFKMRTTFGTFII